MKGRKGKGKKEKMEKKTVLYAERRQKCGGV